MTRRLPPSRRSSTVLSAAALAGGLALTAASPAMAAPVATDDGSTLGYFAQDGLHGRFLTQHSVEEARVTVAPFTVTSAPDEMLDGTAGLETEVESSYDAELERGLIDFTTQRRVLAEEGTGTVMFTLYLDGERSATAFFGPDGNLGDDEPGEFLGTYGPQDYGFEMRPTVDHVTLLSAPGSRMVYLQGNSAGDAPGNSTLTVAEQSEHGTLVELDRVGDPSQWSVDEERGTPGSWVYVADEGFTGTDEAVFTLTHPETGQTKTLVVTYSIGDERADDTVLDVESGALPYDEARMWEALAAGEEDETAAEEESGHEVPEKVQTGDSASWGLAALAAVGVGSLVAARRRLGLSR